MKVKDADILIIPGFNNAGPAHWQSRWEARLSTARRIEGVDWHKPERQAWVDEGLRTAPDLALRVLAVLVTPG